MGQRLAMIIAGLLRFIGALILRLLIVLAISFLGLALGSVLAVNIGPRIDDWLDKSPKVDKFLAIGEKFAESLTQQYQRIRIPWHATKIWFEDHF